MYTEIQQQTDKHSVTELCTVYGGILQRLLQMVGTVLDPSNRYEHTQQRMDTYIADIHAHFPMMGYRDPTVWRSMKRLGVHGYTTKQAAHLLQRYGAYPLCQYPGQKFSI